MGIRKPSPAMVVAVIALVMSMTGGAIAAVNFAKNAGAVDHLSAVKDGKSLKGAAGRLVATQRGGPHRGQIRFKYLDLSGLHLRAPSSKPFDFGVPVTDNAKGGAVQLDANLFGRLTASCNDQSAKAGVEDPSVNVAFTSTFGNPLNLARTIGGGNPLVTQLAPSTVDQFTINSSNTFRIQLEFGGTNLIYDGIVRQLGTGTANATCLVVGRGETSSP